MDFNVDVKVRTSGKEEIDALERQIKALKNETVKINIDVDNKNLNLKNLNTNSIGKQIQNSIGKSVKAVKFNTVKFNPKDSFYKRWLDKEKEYIEEAQKVNKNYQKELEELNTDGIDKNAQKAVQAKAVAERKATQQQIRNRQQEQREIDQIENARLKSIENAKKREAQLEAQQNRHINKAHNDRVKQEQKDNEKRQNLLSKIKNDFSDGLYDTKSSTMKSKIDAYQGQDSDLVKRAREQQELYKDSLSKLNDHFDSEKSFKLNDDEVVAAYNNMTAAAKRFDNIMTQVRNTESKTLGLGVAERSANAVKKYYDENSNAVKKYGIELKDLEKRYRDVKTVEDKANLDNEFKNLKSKISAEGLTGKSSIDEIKRGFKQIGQFALTYGVLQKIPDVLARMANEVLDVDTAMTNLYKVTDETTAKYDEFLGNAGNVSRSLGRDMSSYITQTSEWAKLGYSMDKSANLSKISSIYANVGEVDDKTAVSDMVTAMKAFNIEADNAISVVDSLNALGNNFATSSADLGTGLSNAASSLSTAGNDINQSLAMLTGMTEITQSASESGNALKILSMRLRGYDEETQSYSNDVEELTGKVADLTKTASKPGGISLFSDKDKQTYKSTYKIMEEVSDVWDDLTDKSRAELTEVLAGKNRGNQISALIQSFQSGQVQKAYETSLNSEGSAQQEQDRWMQSMEAKIQQFKSQFQELSTTAMDSDLLKGAIDAGISLLNVLTRIVDVGGTIPIVLGGIGGAKLFKNLDLFY